MNDSAAKFDADDLQHLLAGRPCADLLFPPGGKRKGDAARRGGIDGATNTLARSLARAAVKLDNYANGFAAMSLARSLAQKLGERERGRRASAISPSGMPMSP